MREACAWIELGISVAAAVAVTLGGARATSSSRPESSNGILVAIWNRYLFGLHVIARVINRLWDRAVGRRRPPLKLRPTPAYVERELLSVGSHDRVIAWAEAQAVVEVLAKAVEAPEIVEFVAAQRYLADHQAIRTIHGRAVAVRDLTPAAGERQPAPEVLHVSANHVPPCGSYEGICVADLADPIRYLCTCGAGHQGWASKDDNSEPPADTGGFQMETIRG